MKTQNTPVHIRLWHRDFWLMAMANLLLTVAVYVLIPVMPGWLMQTENLTMRETGLVMGAFGIGIFLFGCFTSFLVQHFRRNIACIWAVLLMAALLAWLYYLDMQKSQFFDFPVLLAWTWTAVHGVTNSQRQLSGRTTATQTLLMTKRKHLTLQFILL